MNRKASRSEIGRRILWLVAGLAVAGAWIWFQKLQGTSILLVLFGGIVLGEIAYRIDLRIWIGSAAESMSATFKEEYPVDKYIEIYAPLHGGGWLRALNREPDAQAELQALLKTADGPEGDPGSWVPKIKACMDRHPALERRIKAEHRIEVANIFRILLLRPVAHPTVKHEEWQAIYHGLEALVVRLAGEAQGSLAYLVDDEMEEAAHKIELYDPDLLTPELVREIQSILKGWKNRWGVILQFTFDRISPDCDPGMLVVWEDDVDEVWDKERMRATLGSRFRM